MQQSLRMLMLDFLSGLSLMHAFKWVHRDLSDGNILVDRSGVGRLADLEYAKSMDDGDEIRIVRLLVPSSSSTYCELSWTFSPKPGHTILHFCGGECPVLFTTSSKTIPPTKTAFARNRGCRGSGHVEQRRRRGKAAAVYVTAEDTHTRVDCAIWL